MLVGGRLSVGGLFSSKYGTLVVVMETATLAPRCEIRTSQMTSNQIFNFSVAMLAAHCYNMHLNGVVLALMYFHFFTIHPHFYILNNPPLPNLSTTLSSKSNNLYLFFSAINHHQRLPNPLPLPTQPVDPSYPFTPHQSVRSQFGYIKSSVFVLLFTA